MKVLGSAESGGLVGLISSMAGQFHSLSSSDKASLLAEHSRNETRDIRLSGNPLSERDAATVIRFADRLDDECKQDGAREQDAGTRMRKQASALRKLLPGYARQIDSEIARLQNKQKQGGR